MNLPKLSQVTSKIQSIAPGRASSHASIFILIDVGSSVVRSVVARVDDEGVHLLGKGRAIQEDGSMVGGAIAQLPSVLERIDEAVTQASDAAGVTSDQLILSLSGALVGGMTTLVHLNRPQPKEKITEKELQLMLERMAQTALVDAEGAVSREMGLDRDDLRLVHSSFASISLDGYILPSPIGFTGKEIEFCLFNAFVSASTLVALQKILTDLNVDLYSLCIGSYAMSQLVIAQAAKSQQVQGVLIDVGAGSTSVTLIEHGVVSGSKTFPLGGRAITSRISQENKVSMEEAEQLKLEYSQGRAPDAQRHHLRPMVTHEMSLWRQALILALAEVRPEEAMPQRIYLTGAASRLPDLEKVLNDTSWHESAGFMEKPEVEPVKIDLPAGIFDETRVVDADDIAILALALTLRQKEREDEKVSSAFQKILQELSRQ